MAIEIDQQIINGDFDTQLDSLELVIRARRKAQREKLTCDEHDFYYDIDHNHDRDSEKQYPQVIVQYCNYCAHQKLLYIGDDELAKIWELLSK